MLKKANARFIVEYIIDNSIYWLDKKETTFKKSIKGFAKKIVIDLVKTKNHFEILIADNGDGFKLPTTQIIKPFITGKDGGMGLGLHITNEIMRPIMDRSIFPNMANIIYRKNSEKGAKVVLKLKKD